MIRLRLSGTNFEPIVAMADRLAHPDLAPLAGRLREIMVEDNRRGLLAGVDCFGDRMTPVMESTIKRGRGGDGEPLNPRGLGSAPIADYQVTIEDIPNGKRLTGRWPNTPYIHFHVTGTRYMVARDPADLRPEGVEEARVAVEEFARNLIGGAR